MPGYLTHAMVLIETERWLSELEGTLGMRRPPSPLELRVLTLARKARHRLRLSDDPTSQISPPLSPARIDPTPRQEKAAIAAGMGHDISQYAFTGSIGHDFPAASHILALNQRWVWRQMHRGSARRSWLKTGSTQFILNAINRIPYVAIAINVESGGRGTAIGEAGTPGQPILGEFQNALVGCLMGHCASLACHVLLHPFIDYVVSKTPEADHQLIEAALDAQVAKGYFQRDDISSDQSWSDYYLSRDEGLKPVLEMYLQAFDTTYGHRGPFETLCGAPTLAALKTEFPALNDLLTLYPALARTLEPYRGYDRLFEGMPALDALLAKDRLEAIEGLKSKLQDYRCKTPLPDRDFLLDGYKNTRNWIIDEGYDKEAFNYRLLWTFAILGGGQYLMYSLWSGLDSFSTITETVVKIVTFGQVKWERDDSKKIADGNRDEWRGQGIGNPALIFDIAAKTYDGGKIFTAFSLMITGIPIIWSDGLFARGTDGFSEAPTSEKVYKVMTIVLKIGSIILGEIVPMVTEHIAYRAADWGLGFVFDLFENLHLAKRDEMKGKEGDVFARQMWHLQLMLWPFNFVGCLLALSWKSTRHNEDDTRETGFNILDHLVALGFQGFGIGLLVWGLKQFDKRIFGEVAGARWPEKDTASVEPYLRVVDDDRKLRHFEDVAGFPVFLYPRNTLQTAPADAVNPSRAQDTAEESRLSYPEGGTGRVESPKKDYKLTKLFERTVYFSGLMALAAVDYADTADKEAAGRIFADWNLDHRAQEEWLDLMETVSGKPGLLEATERWWSDVRANRASEAPVLNRLQRAFKVAETTGAGRGVRVSLQYEDGSPMGDAEFEAVFGETRVRGRTGPDGVAVIDAPAGHPDTYRLFVLSYPELQTAGGVA